MRRRKAEEVRAASSGSAAAYCTRRRAERPGRLKKRPPLPLHPGSVPCLLEASIDAALTPKCGNRSDASSDARCASCAAHFVSTTPFRRCPRGLRSRGGAIPAGCGARHLAVASSEWFFQFQTRNQCFYWLKELFTIYSAFTKHGMFETISE